MEKQVLLVADDDEMNRMLISKFLRNEYEILEAVDGQQAMDIIHERHVDALLLDIIMPKLDGLEVLKLIKADENLEHIGILVATSTKEKTERTALSLGADDIVSKPYDPIVIRKRIENILTVKYIRQQKEDLQSNKLDRIIVNRDVTEEKEAELHYQRLRDVVSIINANISNQKLIGELTAEINHEAKALFDMIKQN